MDDSISCLDLCALVSGGCVVSRKGGACCDAGWNRMGGHFTGY